MKRIVAIITFLVTGIVTSHGQNWAGPDTTTCGELGVIIGSNTPCEECCYLWTPSAGLSDNRVKNPVAKPGTTTIYTVEVTDKNLRSKGSDQVVVELDFAEMKFSKDFLLQGSEEMATVELLKKNGIDSPSQITWKILPDSLNCGIEAQGLGAKITAGDRYGTITVEASKNSVPGCKTKGTLNINNGVKDVIASDPDSPGRKASQGQTLSVVDQTSVLIKAIPNPVGFATGVPDWKQDSYGSSHLTDGQAEGMVSKPHGLDGNYAEYIAGDSPEFNPKVGVKRFTNVEFAWNPSPQIEEFMDYIKTKLKFAKYDDEGGDVLIPCGSGELFSIEPTGLDYVFKKSIVEKYNSPDTALKTEAAIETGFQVSGNVYHPYFTRNFYLGIVTVCSKLWMGASTGITLALNGSADPSRMDPGWQLDNAQIKVPLKLSSGAQVVALTMGWEAHVSATFSVSAELIAEFTFSDKKLNGFLETKPAWASIESQVNKISDINQILKTYNLPSAEIQLIDKYKSPPYLLMQF